MTIGDIVPNRPQTTPARNNGQARWSGPYSPHQGKYFSHWLTQRSRGEAAVVRAISTAQVDMNPHQVDAALFALKSPVEAGVLLADEVGLGKTIEAGLVLSQYWAQKRRRLLLITPATLRKQWSQELLEKFQLPSAILEGKTFNDARKKSVSNPFIQDDLIVITSYEFASSKHDLLSQPAWDLVVLDEAHKLRNLYKGKADAKRASMLNEALRGRRKVLLTATPFQNSLMELYGLVSFISDEYFGSAEAFQMQYATGRATEGRLDELRHRLKPICHRTLRRQVQAEGGINFTKRFSITQDFTPSDQELALYDNVSMYLQDPEILGIRKNARHLTTLVIRKILASSSFAIADTLDAIVKRLEARQELGLKLLTDYETTDELIDESDVADDAADSAADPHEPLQAELFQRQDEINRLSAYRDLARRIQVNRKGDALLVVLKKAFHLAERLGGQKKAVIFTESRRTQEYLRDLLEASGYAGRTVLLNGSNDDADSKALLAAWQKRHAGTTAISGSRTADMKAAVVSAFREDRDLLITTEAGGEGINLQFCSLLVNYDLPWNPQRVEQRIGRVHRYGQKSDVVVVNFVNRKNRADELVYALLEKKFKLFDGVFGASDEILGAIESGVDIEQRIHDIIQRCRNQDEIEREFAVLQSELEEVIASREAGARRAVLEQLDDVVVGKLRSRRTGMLQELSHYERQFVRLVQAVRPQAQVADRIITMREGRFAVSWPPAQEAHAGLLRPDEGLGAEFCAMARTCSTPEGHLCLDYAALDTQLADVKTLIGVRGVMKVALVTLESPRETLDELVVAAVCDDGRIVPGDTAARLLEVPGRFTPASHAREPAVMASFEAGVAAVLASAAKRNERWFMEESERLDRWADDQRFMLKQQVDVLDAQIREGKRTLRQLDTLEQKAQLKREIRRVEQERDTVMLEFYERRKLIDARQETLLDEVEVALKLSHRIDILFEVSWTLEHAPR